VNFERTLDDYFNSEMPETFGLPIVKYCAENIHLSANYLGDLIKKETGKSPKEHIQLKLILSCKDNLGLAIFECKEKPGLLTKSVSLSRTRQSFILTQSVFSN
jgi:hypothetical protein